MHVRSSRETPSTLRQWRGVVALLGDTYAQLTRGIHEFHRAISDPPFKALSAVPAIRTGAAPVRVLHDGITDTVYTGVKEFGALAFEVAGSALQLIEAQTSHAAHQPHPRTDLAFSALSGLFGDHLIGRRNPVAPQFALYHDGVKLEIERAALAASFADAQPRVVVFVHGLCCNETAWQFFQKPDDDRTRPYGERLREHGYTPLYLRYNSGAHISHNGRRLDRLLRQLLAHWPVPIDDITLIGHSMGGLVIRSAAASGQQRNQAWTQKVGNIFCIGAPHQGAALERGAEALAQILHSFALSQPWARVLDARSVGIRDLRFGATSDADWRAGLVRQWRPPQPVARLATARYHFIGCSIGAHASDWRGALLGDGLVHLPSALAAPLTNTDSAVLFQRHHLQLLNDPAVYALIGARLGLATRPPRIVAARRKTARPRRAAPPPR